MSDDLLDLLTFLAWMAVPIALGVAALWLTRPKRIDETEAEPDTETTIETRRRMNDA
jgi:hypothetical protein